MSMLRFNEAAAFQLRNLRLSVRRVAVVALASMRPQRFSCGIRILAQNVMDADTASMRPQRFSCGIQIWLPHDGSSNELQ